MFSTKSFKQVLLISPSLIPCLKKYKIQVHCMPFCHECFASSLGLVAWSIKIRQKWKHHVLCPAYYVQKTCLPRKSPTSVQHSHYFFQLPKGAKVNHSELPFSHETVALIHLLHLLHSFNHPPMINIKERTPLVFWIPKRQVLKSFKYKICKNFKN